MSPKELSPLAARLKELAIDPDDFAGAIGMDAERVWDLVIDAEPTGEEKVRLRVLDNPDDIARRINYFLHKQQKKGPVDIGIKPMGWPGTYIGPATVKLTDRAVIAKKVDV